MTRFAPLLARRNRWVASLPRPLVVSSNMVTRSVLVLAGLLAGCKGEAPPPERDGEAAVKRAKTPVVTIDNAPSIPASRMRFVDVASEAGIDFRFFNDMIPGRYFLPEVMGGGVGWIDYDADGRPDLYAVNGRPLILTAADAARAAQAPKQGNRLYRQMQSAQFTDVASGTGADVDAYGNGIAIGDFDADGFDDLFLANYGGDTLLRNNGDGTFADVTADAGTSDPHWSTSCVWHDLNDDRLLDIYVANYMDVTPQTHKVCVDGGKPKYCGPGDYAGVADVVYLNSGDGTFVNVTADLGFSVPPPANGLGVLVADFDDDLVPEIYVANDMEPNFLFQRSSPAGSTHYRDIAGNSGCAVGGGGSNEASMGIACGDLDGDGRPDLYLTHYHHTKNTFYRNLGGLLFDDQSRRSGIAEATYERTGFGTVAADFDRDADLDLFAANGHVLGPEQRPFEMEPGLLQNDEGQFSDASSMAGSYFRTKVLGRGAASADFDDDGDIDLAVSHLDHPLALLANESDPVGPFVGFELMTEDRLPPVGGRIRVEVNGRTWVLPVVAGGSYLSSSDRRLFIGLGKEDGPLAIEVFWPSGEISRYEGIEPNAYWRIYESGRPPERHKIPTPKGRTDEG